MSSSPNVSFFSILVVSALLALTAPMPASSDPPGWAPAHGYRHEHHKHHHHDDDHHHNYRDVRHHDRYGDYGIRAGRCDTHAVAQVLGGVAGGALGGVLGSQVDQSGSAGTIAEAVAGTIVGAIIGNQIGRSMDPYDRFCASRVFDFADDHHGVRWRNPQTQVNYLLTPLTSFQRDGNRCREFTTRISHAGLQDDLRQTACRLPNGDWQIRS